MSNASHRNTEAVKTPRIPWGTVLAVVVLIMALSGGIMLVSALATPANASTGYLTPAVTAAKTVGHVTPWQRVLSHCKKVGCVSHVPAAMRRDMGIKPGQAYRVHYGDTTFVWVKLPHGRVRTITS